MKNQKFPIAPFTLKTEPSEPHTFWLVWRKADYADRHTPEKRHPSEKSALDESLRLAQANPGVKFYVVKSLGFSESKIAAATFTKITKAKK